MTSTPFEKPILLLDVDGVLNAFAPVRPHTTHVVGPYNVRFDNEIVDMIDALAESFEIHWATMWNSRANSQIAPVLGIDPFPVLFCDHARGWDEARARGLGDYSTKLLWFAKSPLIPAHVAGRPFAWVDDDHGHADRAFLVTQSDCSDEFLLLQTNAKSGLTWDDVATLNDWAAKQAYGSLSIPRRRIAA
jgi:hypothetical protein